MENQTRKVAVAGNYPGGLGIIIAFLSRLVDPLIKLGVIIAGTALFAMMTMTFVDVAGRWVINKPIPGSIELTEFYMALIAAFGIGYCGLRKGHIRVDILFQYAPQKVNRWLDILAYGLTFIIFFVVTWRVFLNAVSSLQAGQTSAILHIPNYPFIFIVVIGAAILSLVMLRDLLKSIAEVMK
jgi:TRAP-type C4-dicarboxylate transport system permease small subunit